MREGWNGPVVQNDLRRRRSIGERHASRDHRRVDVGLTAQTDRNQATIAILAGPQAADLARIY